MSSITCVSKTGITYVGITNENGEIHLTSSETPNEFTENVKGDLIIDSYCKNNEKEYKITQIKSYCFINSKVTSVTVTSTIKNIQGGSFEAAPNLKFADLSRTKIAELIQYTFSRCYNLENVLLPDTIRSIGENCFQSCNKLVSLKLPRSLSSINDLAFGSVTSLKTIYYCGKNEIVSGLPTSITTIYAYKEYKYSTLSGSTVTKNVSFCYYDRIKTCMPNKPKVSNWFMNIVLLIFS